MNRIFIALITALLVMSTPLGYTYDHSLASSYAALFQPVHGAKAGKQMHFMTPEVFVEKLKKGEDFVTVDVRTEKESGLFSMSLPGGRRIPINELFKSANLDQLPTDKPMVIVCKSGARASAAGTALRHIGFKNVYILKGGYKALMAYAGPKEMYAPAMVKQVGAR